MMAIVIGLTGGIASGKSTVANMLKKRGVTIIDADVEAHLAVEKGEQAYEQIIETFGEEILHADRSIDRLKLGTIIFHDEEKRKLLNQIVHPAVRERMKRKQSLAEANGAQYIVLDIPLLFESNLIYMVEKILLVYVDEDTQTERLMHRNDLSRDEAVARIRSQMPLIEKKQLADEVIDNNGTIDQTEKQLLEILNRWGLIEN